MTKTISIEEIRKSSIWITIPSGTVFRRLNSKQNVTKFLFRSHKTQAIPVMQGEYVFAFENHIWSVSKHFVKEENKK